jgi:predicted RNA-binding protein (virulence factor B family)
MVSYSQALDKERAKFKKRAYALLNKSESALTVYLDKEKNKPENVKNPFRASKIRFKRYMKKKETIDNNYNKAFEKLSSEYYSNITKIRVKYEKK